MEGSGPLPRGHAPWSPPGPGVSAIVCHTASGAVTRAAGLTRCNDRAELSSSAFHSGAQRALSFLVDPCSVPIFLLSRICRLPGSHDAASPPSTFSGSQLASQVSHAVRRGAAFRERCVPSAHLCARRVILSWVPCSAPAFTVTTCVVLRMGAFGFSLRGFLAVLFSLCCLCMSCPMLSIRYRPLWWHLKADAAEALCMILAGAFMLRSNV